MTDKEKACKYICDDTPCRTICEKAECYIAGLAEGKPKWHDLRKTPNDFPPRIKKISETVINEFGTPCFYNFEKSCWQNWSYIDIETPIAWCELPEFEAEAE